MNLKTPILIKRRTPILILFVLALAVSVLCAAVLIGNRRSSGSAATGAAAGQLATYAGQAAAIQATETSEPGWPRKITSGGTTVLFYIPEIEKWEGDQIQANAAVSVEPAGSTQLTYGKVHFTTHAVTDKASRQVTLDNFKVTGGEFPTAPDKASEYLSIIQQAEGEKVETVPEDQLLSDLAIAETQRKTSRELKNDPPRIIFSSKPAVLVLIDGQPVLRPVGEGTDLQRVINTRSLILFDQSTNAYYLTLMNGWVQAPSPEGPWTFASRVPPAANKVRATLAKNGQIDVLSDDNKGSSREGGLSGHRQTRRVAAHLGTESLSVRLKTGTFPIIYVSTVPAELLTSEGDMQFKPIPGTGLLYVANTGDQIFMNTANQNYYVLISGRWFTSRSMDGPWAYVDGKDLPPDFAKIPEGDPKASVLASTPGTAAAREAAIANEIPQTATIDRHEAQLTVTYDGDPRFEPIPGTHLQTAVNSVVPVIEVSSSEFMAVQNGVWFTSTSALGPWVVATNVPAEIYSIPPRSRVHNVTYVRTYGYTDDAVYTGYTPGYYGTVLEPDGLVAYGTGWYYPPYVGSYWTGWPWTYGFGAGFGWSPVVGWGFGFGQGFVTPFYAPWWSPFWWGSPVAAFDAFPAYGFGWGFPVWGWGFPVARFGFGFPVWRSFGFGAFAWNRGFGWGDRFVGRGFRSEGVFDRWGRSAFVGTNAGWTGGRFAGNISRAGFVNRAAALGGHNLRAGLDNSRMGAIGNARGGAFGGNSAFAGNSKMGIFGGTRAGAVAGNRMNQPGTAGAGALGSAGMNGSGRGNSMNVPGNSRMGAAGNSRLGSLGNPRGAGPGGGAGNSRGNALAGRGGGVGNERGNAFAGSRGSIGANSRANAFAGSRAAMGGSRGNAFAGSRGASIAPRMGGGGTQRAFAGPRGGFSSPRGGFASRGGFSSPRMGGGFAQRGGFSSPRGFAAAPRGGFSAPRMGGGSSAPRMNGFASHGGGFGGGGFGGRGGGGFAAPRGGMGGGGSGGHGGGGFGGGGFSGGRGGGGGGGGHRR